MTMYRMRQRELNPRVDGRDVCAAAVAARSGTKHRDTILALHTHTQRAQPSAVAHYMLAVIEQLERDGGGSRRRSRAPTAQIPARRLRHHRTDRSQPDVRELLGFSGPTCNTYGSIATVDYPAREHIGVERAADRPWPFRPRACCCGAPAEFGYLRLSNSYVQGSSIMPQKRNPVALEHARAIGSKALGQAQAIVLTAHNTPFGDIVDTEDDLQPLVFAMFRDATRAVQLVAAAMGCRGIRRGEARSARRRRLDDAHRAGGYAGEGAWHAVQAGARDQPRTSSADGSAIRNVSWRRCSPTRPLTSSASR